MLQKHKILNAINEGIKSGFKFSSNQKVDNSTIIDFNDSKIKTAESLNIAKLQKEVIDVFNDRDYKTLETYYDNYGDLIFKNFQRVEVPYNDLHKIFIDAEYKKISYIITKIINCKIEDKDQLRDVICFFDNRSHYVYDLNFIDVSSITNMDELFKNLKYINGDISKWDVSSVTSMNRMFYNCTDFNSSLNNWDVSNVRNMQAMFFNCENFDQPLDNWDMSNVENADFMFAGSKFNQNVKNWKLTCQNQFKVFVESHISKNNMPAISNNIDINKLNYDFLANALDDIDFGYMYSKIYEMSYIKRNFYKEKIILSKEQFNGFIPFLIANNSIVNLEKRLEILKIIVDIIKYQPTIDELHNIAKIFNNSNKYNDIHLNWLDVSKITNMSNIFQNLTSFNSDISEWDVSNVKNMSNMFLCCSSFNKPINDWNVSNVNSMDSIFAYCTNFNQPLDKWNVSNVTNLSFAFYNCVNFNQNINSWNVSNVRNLINIFNGCSIFNQPLNDWNISKVTSIAGAFANCSIFDQPLNKWDVSHIKDMTNLFDNCACFNQNLNNWNVSHVTKFSGIFTACSYFNQPLDKWNVSNASHLDNMFFDCKNFNQPLNSWNVSKVTNATNMFFNCEKFNQPLNNWNVAKMRYKSFMFAGCKSFNQDLSNWEVKKTNIIYSMFKNCLIDRKNKPLYIQENEAKYTLAESINTGFKFSSEIIDNSSSLNFKDSKINIAHSLSLPTYKFIDLNLPSGIRWAEVNLGATCEDTPESWYGDYYAWGETKTKYDYSIEKYQSDLYTTYNKQYQTLFFEDDIVNLIFHGIINFRMPTIDDFNELKNNSIFKWETNYNDIKGLNGATFTGNNGNFIFIPASGRFNNVSKYFVSNGSCLWSNTLSNSSNYACMFDITSVNAMVYTCSRYCGLSIRAVCE